jgi:hypothetical protein
MKVDIERRGARGGDLPDALGVQPYYDPISPQEVSLSICRTACSVTKNGEKIAELLSKETYPCTGIRLGKAIEKFLDVRPVIRPRCTNHTGLH